MRLRGKNLRDITPEDISDLVSDEVPESVQLDYKQALPGDTDSDRKEFVKDVTAMANTSGGVLLYGVTERADEGQRTGLPEKIVGVGDMAPDHVTRRLENIIRDRTDPPLTSCVARTFAMTSGEAVVAVGVPGSFLGPHAVKSGGTGTYWRRTNTSNYAVGTSELREMFLQRATWEDQVEQYRRSRTTAMRQRSIVPNLDVDGSFFLHVLPLGRLHEKVNIMPLRDEFAQKVWNVIGISTKRRANLDGYLLLVGDDPDCKDYVQWFRNAGIEFYSSRFHRREKEGQPLNFAASQMAVDVKRMLALALEFFDRLAVEPPFAILLSVFDVLGGSIPTEVLSFEEQIFNRIETNRFDRDPIFIPAVTLEDPTQALDEVLLPALDMLWQAAGINECFLRRLKKGW